MANKKQTGFPVMIAQQGQAPKVVNVGSGATVRSALVAAKLDPANLAGAVTLNGEGAELTARLKRDDYIAVTPKVAGGR